MTDFDSPMDPGPRETPATLPWESIDPDESDVALVDSEAVAPPAVHGADHDWAATAFLADEEPPPLKPKRALHAIEKHRAPQVADPLPQDGGEQKNGADDEGKTPWTDLEPVMAEISTPQIDVPSVAAKFARTDAILAAASELATLAESIQTSPPPRANAAEAIPHHAPAETDYTGLAMTAAPLDVEAMSEAALEAGVELEVEPAAVTTHGGWTIPLMCLGIGLIACCLVIPQGDFNRRLRYEQTSLETNLKSIEKQASVNDEFLKKLADDPGLAERLSSRQLKTIRKGQKILPLASATGDEAAEMSPFGLVAVAPPPAPEAYRPARGTIADLCNNARARLYLLGSATMMVAVGLVMGFGEKKPE